MVAETGATVRVERFTGHMGMFNLHHLQVHLRSNLIRRQGGLRVETCVVSEDAEFRAQIPAEFAGLYTVVPQARVRELLETDDDRYRAVLSDRKGCVNSGAARPAGARVPRAAIPRSLPVRRPDPRRRVVVERRPGRRSRRAGTRDGVAGGAVHQRLRRPCRAGRGRRTDPAGRRPADHRPGRLHDGLRRGPAAVARRR